MTYSIPLPSDETNAPTADDTIPQGPTDTTGTSEVGADGADHAEARSDGPAPSNDAADPTSDDAEPTGTDGPVGVVPVPSPGGAVPAAVIPAAVIPDETAEDVPAAGGDDPLRVPHDSEEDWEEQFVKDPEAAKEATRERMDEQFEREHEERTRAAENSDAPDAAQPGAAGVADLEGRHAATEPVTDATPGPVPTRSAVTPTTCRRRKHRRTGRRVLAPPSEAGLRTRPAVADARWVRLLL